VPRAREVRAPRLRRAARGAPPERRGGRGPLSGRPVRSAHLPDTRVGPLTIWVSDRGVRRIEFGPLPTGHHVDPPEARGPELEVALEQLEEYLAGERRAFDLRLDLWCGTTPFPRQGYGRLLQVPYGHGASYGRIAGELGRPDLAL